MPTYEYQCDACGHLFEHFQSMSSRKLRKCPACAKPKLVRLVGAGAGVIFKGSGFYETDYKQNRDPAAKDTASKDTGSEGASAKDTSSKADTSSKGSDSSTSDSGSGE